MLKIKFSVKHFREVMMTRKHIHFPQKSIHISRPHLWHPTPWAAKLCIWGLLFLLAGIGDTYLRIRTQINAGSVGIMWRYAYAVECILCGLTILAGGVLILDYMERHATLM